MLYRFSNIELDLDTFELRRDGRVLPVRKMTFDVLCYLIAHRERVVTKQELLKELWSGTHVNESAISWYVSNIRKTVGQEHSDRNLVETVHGRGYQFKGEVEIVAQNHQPNRTSSTKLASEDAEPFVGRDDVMAVLARAVECVRAGRGKIVILRGEAGIGKTRCVAELSRNLIGSNHSLWTGRCPETAGQPPFWPWTQILRNAVRERPGDSSVILESSRLIAILAPRPGKKTASAPVDYAFTATDRFWLYDRLLGFLSLSSMAAPRFLVIDDIHWADEASLEFLSFIAPDVERQKLLLVLTLRDHEAMGNRSVYLHRVLRYAKQIPLTRLSEDAVVQYLSHSDLFNGSKELSRALYHKTGGNPLFLHETFRWLQWTRANTDEPLTVEAIHQLDVPDSIEKLLRRRLNFLDQQSRHILNIASVMGRNFNLALLSETLRRDIKTLSAMLDRAIDAGLVTRESASCFRFTHDLICEVAYESLPMTTRAEYHNRIATTLNERPDADTAIEEAAFHFHRALPLSDIDAAIRTSLKAAELSAKVHAHGDAATYYRWALEAMSLSDAIDSRVRVNTMVALGTQERMFGDIARSRQTINEALKSARFHRLFDIVADIAYIGRATFLAAHIPKPVVREALVEALDYVPLDDKALRIRLLGQLAQTPPISTDIPRCKQMSQQAVRLAEELGDPRSMQIALNATLASFLGPDGIDNLLESADRILEIQPEGEWYQAGIEALLARILAFTHRGDMAEAKKAIEVFGQLMTQLHRGEGEWLYQRLLAQQLLDEGRFDDAIEQFIQLKTRARRIGIYYFDRFHTIQQAYIMRSRGSEVAHVRDLCADTVRLFRHVPFSLASIIGLVVDMGFPELIEDSYERLIVLGIDAVPRNAWWLNTLSNLSLAAVAFDDRRTIKQLYEMLSRYAGFNTPDGAFLYDGSVAHYLAILASKLDSDAKVIQYFEQAIDANQRMGFRPQLLRSQVVFAEWLKERDQKKHNKRLETLVDRALKSAREMKMDPFLRRVEALDMDCGKGREGKHLPSRSLKRPD